MTAQEAIMVLNMVETHGSLPTKAKELAIKALEKQIPKKPYLWGDGYSDGHMVYDMWDCPHCGNTYEIECEKYDCCPNCGQHIDRGDDMERLTMKWKDGVYDTFNPIDIEDNEYSKINYEKLLTKLGEYEDLEEQGLLLRLPCKLGDTAYYVHREYSDKTKRWFDKIDEVEVDSFVLNVNLFVNVSMYIGGDRFGKTLTPYKTLFFTQEEAEIALEKMKRKEHEG